MALYRSIAKTSLCAFFFVPLICCANYDACFEQASKRYQVNVQILKSIADVESGHYSLARNINKSSEDVGVMQINSLWFPYLEKKYGITREILLLNPCVNIHVGAWILAQNIQKYGYNWNAVGAFNAGDPEKRKIYVNKVWKKYQKREFAHFVNDSHQSKGNNLNNMHHKNKIVITSQETHGF